MATPLPLPPQPAASTPYPAASPCQMQSGFGGQFPAGVVRDFWWDRDSTVLFCNMRNGGAHAFVSVTFQVATTFSQLAANAAAEQIVNTFYEQILAPMQEAILLQPFPSFKCPMQGQAFTPPDLYILLNRPPGTNATD